jgi:hypothetical protein
LKWERIIVRMHDDENDFLLTVRGEQFRMRRRAGSPNVYDYTWLSGPNPGYGFTSALNVETTLTMTQHGGGIEQFLDAIDPLTGYLGDSDGV